METFLIQTMTHSEPCETSRMELFLQNAQS